MSNNSDRFERMQAMQEKKKKLSDKHKARHKREDELAAQGVDYIAETRAGPIGRLVDRMLKYNPDAIPLSEIVARERARYNAKNDDSD